MAACMTTRSRQMRRAEGIDGKREIGGCEVGVGTVGERSGRKLIWRTGGEGVWGLVAGGPEDGISSGREQRRAVEGARVRGVEGVW